MAKLFNFLRERFKQSQDYKYEFLIRDLRDFADDVGKQFETYTWTPAITFGGAAAGMTYSVRSGTGLKIGKMFILGFNLQLSAKGSSVGVAQMGGFPIFAANNQEAVAALQMSGMSNMAGITSPLISALGVGPTATLRQIGATGQVDLTEANFAATTFMRGIFTGITA